MKTYLVPQVSGEPDWDAVPAAPIDTLQWSPPVPVRAEARLCWDRDALLVRLRAWEPAVRAVHRGRLCAVCEDSCLEFFLRPWDDMRYLNFEFNLNCALYLGIGTGMDTEKVRSALHECTTEPADENAILGVHKYVMP